RTARLTGAATTGRTSTNLQAFRRPLEAIRLVKDVIRRARTTQARGGVVIRRPNCPASPPKPSRNPCPARGPYPSELFHGNDFPYLNPHRRAEGTPQAGNPLSQSARPAVSGGVLRMKVLISAASIQQRVQEMGQQITADYQGKELTIVGVLTGS